MLSYYLQSLGYDSKTIKEIGLKGKSDGKIIGWMQEQQRILITADLDFGEFFYLKTFGKIGVIILRSRFQALESFQKIITYLHTQRVLRNSKLENALVVAAENSYRIRQYI